MGKWDNLITMTTYCAINDDFSASTKQCQMIGMLMSNLFNGEQGRKLMLREYFGVKSTKDLTFKEAQLAIELLLNQSKSLLDFYEQFKNDQRTKN